MAVQILPQNIRLSGGTAAAALHLTDPIHKRGHGLPKGSARQIWAQNQQASIEQAMATAEGQSFKRRRLYDHAGETLDGSVVENLYVNFLVSCSLPFRLVECHEFRAFLTFLNKEVDVWLPASHVHVKTWLMRQFKDLKGKAKLLIQSARTRITYTFLVTFGHPRIRLQCWA